MHISDTGVRRESWFLNSGKVKLLKISYSFYVEYFLIMDPVLSTQ